MAAREVDPRLYIEGSLPPIRLVKSNIADGCYDVTLSDGTRGTFIDYQTNKVSPGPTSTPPTTKDPSPSVNHNPSPPITHNPSPSITHNPAPSITHNPAPSIIPSEKSLLKPPTSPIRSKANPISRKVSPVNNKVSTKPPDTQREAPKASSLMRRHQLIDIHGLAVFLRQSTRCLSCSAASCLYITGTISAQLAAVTQVKITCDKCHYTATQVLARPPASDDQDPASKPLNGHLDNPRAAQHTSVLPPSKRPEQGSQRAKKKKSPWPGSSPSALKPIEEIWMKEEAESPPQTSLSAAPQSQGGEEQGGLFTSSLYDPLLVRGEEVAWPHWSYSASVSPALLDQHTNLGHNPGSGASGGHSTEQVATGSPPTPLVTHRYLPHLTPLLPSYLAPPTSSTKPDLSPPTSVSCVSSTSEPQQPSLFKYLTTSLGPTLIPSLFQGLLQEQETPPGSPMQLFDSRKKLEKDLEQSLRLVREVIQQTTTTTTSDPGEHPTTPLPSYNQHPALKFPSSLPDQTTKYAYDLLPHTGNPPPKNEEVASKVRQKQQRDVGGASTTCNKKEPNKKQLPKTQRARRGRKRPDQGEGSASEKKRRRTVGSDNSVSSHQQAAKGEGAEAAGTANHPLHRAPTDPTHYAMPLTAWTLSCPSTDHHRRREGRQGAAEGAKRRKKRGSSGGTGGGSSSASSSSRDKSALLFEEAVDSEEFRDAMQRNIELFLQKTSIKMALKSLIKKKKRKRQNGQRGGCGEPTVVEEVVEAHRKTGPWRLEEEEVLEAHRKTGPWRFHDLLSSDSESSSDSGNEKLVIDVDQ